MTNFFVKPKKPVFWALFARIFPENPAPSLFRYYNDLTSCKKSEKTNERFLRKTPNGQTDGRTDGQTRVKS